jgi:hypothetical protein
MKKKLGTCLGVLGILAAMAILPAGCASGTTGTTGTALQDATAVQLETSLISSMDGLLKYAIYSSLHLPVTTTTTGL